MNEQARVSTRKRDRLAKRRRVSTCVRGEMRQARPKASSFNVQARNANAAKVAQLRNGQCGIPFHSPGAVRRVLQYTKCQTPDTTAHRHTNGPGQTATSPPTRATTCATYARFSRGGLRGDETGEFIHATRALCAGMTLPRPCAPDCETVRMTPPPSPWPASKTKRTFSSPALLGCSGFMRTTKGKGLVGRPRCEEHSNVKTA